MSMFIAWEYPSASAMWAPATAPAQGPESTAAIGLSWMDSTPAIPPLDCMTRSRTDTPELASTSSTMPRYARTDGVMKALATVVLARSYSPTSGATELESEISRPGLEAVSSSLTRSSWSGRKNEKSRQMATASTSLAASRVAISRTRSSSRGVTTVPVSRILRPPVRGVRRIMPRRTSRASIFAA